MATDFHRNILRRVLQASTFFAIAYYLSPFESVKIVRVEGDDEAYMTEDGLVRDDENVDDTDNPDEEEGSGFFLPIMWPVEEERTFYKGSDPEWQEFVKFANNQSRRKEVIGE
jgi:hypothetical protein